MLKPWITKGILKSTRYKNRLYKMLCKNNFSNTQKVKEYKTYRNKLIKIKIISKENILKKDYKTVIKVQQILRRLSIKLLTNKRKAMNFSTNLIN